MSNLEAIHFFVELLDQYFGNVCELDLVFNFHKVPPTAAHCATKAFCPLPLPPRRLCYCCHRHCCQSLLTAHCHCRHAAVATAASAVKAFCPLASPPPSPATAATAATAGYCSCCSCCCCCCYCSCYPCHCCPCCCCCCPCCCCTPVTAAAAADAAAHTVPLLSMPQVGLGCCAVREADCTVAQVLAVVDEFILAGEIMEVRSVPPYRRTAVSPYCLSVSPYHRIIIQPSHWTDHLTTLPPYHRTTVPPYLTHTTVPPYRLTVPPYHCTTIPYPYHRTTDRFLNDQQFSCASQVSKQAIINRLTVVDELD